MSAGRRRRVAAATGRGRGGRSARGACCGSVPVPVPIAVVRQSKRRRQRGKRGCRSRLRRAGGGCGLNARKCGTSACLLTPIAPHLNPAAKAPRLPLSPEKASVDLVARSYSAAMGHSIGPTRNNTNETPRCPVGHATARTRTRNSGVGRSGDAANTNEASACRLATATPTNTRRRSVKSEVSAEGFTSFGAGFRVAATAR